MSRERRIGEVGSDACALMFFFFFLWGQERGRKVEKGGEEEDGRVQMAKRIYTINTGLTGESSYQSHLQSVLAHSESVQH